MSRIDGTLSATLALRLCFEIHKSSEIIVMEFVIGHFERVRNLRTLKRP